MLTDTFLDCAQPYHPVGGLALSGSAGEGRGMSTRRNLLVGAAGIVAGGGVLPIATPPVADQPDAELIRICAEYIANPRWRHEEYR